MNGTKKGKGNCMGKMKGTGRDKGKCKGKMKGKGRVSVSVRVK
jgi:hypothetical protein